MAWNVFVVIIFQSNTRIYLALILLAKLDNIQYNNDNYLHLDSNLIYQCLEQSHQKIESCYLIT